MEMTREAIPTWALCYLVNGDPTGLSKTDKADVDRWLSANNVELVSPTQGQEGECKPYFTRCPAFGLPTEAVDCDVLLR